MSDDSKTVRERVIKARKFENERLKKIYNIDNLLNSSLSGKQIEESSNIIPEAMELLTKSAEKLKLSARGYYKTMKVARTIADMEQRDIVIPTDISMALSFRRKLP